MNRKTLEALVIDRELGELSEEAAELLDAYLAEHPEEMAARDSLCSLLGDTRSALKKQPLPIPATQAVAPWKKFSGPQVPSWLAQAAIFLLCLCGGAALGWHLRSMAQPLSSPDSGAALVRALPGASSPAVLEGGVLSVSGYVKTLRARGAETAPARAGIPYEVFGSIKKENLP